MIETERLILRPWIESDREAFIAIINDPEVGRWLGGVLSREAADAAFDRMGAFWREHGYGQLALMRTADNTLLGRVGCRRVPMEWNHPMSGEVEVGWLQARSAWGNGYVTEAAAAMLDWGYKALDVEVIHSWTARLNTRSAAVMQRIGMARTPDLDFDDPGHPTDDPMRPHVVYLRRAAPQ